MLLSIFNQTILDTSSSSNNRIAKNTMMLYIRMLLKMLVTLYTSRVVLNALGVVDYGIYNVVGGFLTIFGFLSGAMTNATQRFLSFELGRKDNIQLGRVFSMSINIHFIIAIIVLLLAETIGLWFVNTKLIIPPERMNAVQWVYQLSILTMMISIISVPYNAIIIAYERMNVFAIISIVEVILKLLIVFMLQWFGFDKLIFYAVLMFSVSLIIRVIYSVYCNNEFKESKFRLFWEKSLFKTLIVYAGWSLWGNGSFALRGQGVNILMNMFYGPTVNAARGISYQVRAAAYQLAQNFQIAVNPQIVKLYANNNLKEMHQLIFQSAKFSFYLILVLCIPILLETSTVLKLWLNIVPDYTIIFTQLVIIDILLDSFARPLMTAVQATGKIKLHEIITGSLQLLNLPITYIFFKVNYPPQIALVIGIIISSIALCVRLIILRKMIGLNIIYFINNVVIKAFSVAVISIILPFIIKYFTTESFWSFLLICLTSIISTVSTIYIIGLNRQEKVFVLKFMTQIKNKL